MDEEEVVRTLLVWLLSVLLFLLTAEATHFFLWAVGLPVDNDTLWRLAILLAAAGHEVWENWLL